MSITDAQTRLAQGQSVTAAGATASQNIYDTLVAGRNIARGEPFRVSVTADVAFVGGTGLTFTYEDSPNPDGSGSTVLATSPTLITPNAGKLWDIHLVRNTQRYLLVRCTSTGAYTSGSFSANIVHDTDYPMNAPANTGF